MVKAVADRAASEAYVENFYKSNIRYLIESHRKRAQGVILVTQAANPALVLREGNDLFVGGADYGEWAVTLDVVNECTRSVCREYPADCHLIDLSREVKFELSDFYDLVHTTPQGARRIGEYLPEKLVPIMANRPP